MKLVVFKKNLPRAGFWLELVRMLGFERNPFNTIIGTASSDFSVHVGNNQLIIKTN